MQLQNIWELPKTTLDLYFILWWWWFTHPDFPFELPICKWFKVYSYFYVLSALAWKLILNHPVSVGGREAKGPGTWDKLPLNNQELVKNYFDGCL